MSIIPGEFERIPNPYDDDAENIPPPSEVVVQKEEQDLRGEESEPVEAEEVEDVGVGVAEDIRIGSASTPIVPKKRPVSTQPASNTSRFNTLRVEFAETQLRLLQVEHEAKMRVYDQQLRAAIAMEHYYTSTGQFHVASYPHSSEQADSNIFSNSYH